MKNNVKKFLKISLVSVGLLIGGVSVSSNQAHASVRHHHFKTTAIKSLAVSNGTALKTANGLSASEQAAQNWIAQHESGGSYTAQNGQYYGKYQLGLTLLHGNLSPKNQEKTANQYVINRYGSWVNAKAFWVNNGWY